MDLRTGIGCCRKKSPNAADRRFPKTASFIPFLAGRSDLPMLAMPTTDTTSLKVPISSLPLPQGLMPNLIQSDIKFNARQLMLRATEI